MELLKGYFTVPSDVSDERVLERKGKYISRYADSYSKEGWALLSPIAFDKQNPPLTEDIKQGRSRWLIMAYWDRRPKRYVFEVDEKHIPTLVKTGKYKRA